MEEKVVRKSLVDQVYDLILKRIQKRELVPGDRLNIEELAKDFGVSRTPVRETINRMIQEGFVEQKHNVGPSIVQLNEEQELDLIDANSSLFSLVIDSYHRLDTLEPLVTELEKMVSIQEEAFEQNEEQRSHEASVGFHKVLISYCTNPIIRDYTMKTQNQINMCTFSYLSERDKQKMSIEEHKNIMNALQAGDIPAAKVLMEQHNRAAKSIYFHKKEI